MIHQQFTAAPEPFWLPAVRITHKIVLMQLNPPFTTSLLHRRDDLSMEEVRAIPRYQAWSDEELTDLIASLKTFTEIIYAVWSQPSNTGTSTPTTLIPFHPSKKAA